MCVVLCFELQPHNLTNTSEGLLLCGTVQSTALHTWEGHTACTWKSWFSSPSPFCCCIQHSFSAAEPHFQTSPAELESVSQWAVPVADVVGGCGLVALSPEALLRLSLRLRVGRAIVLPAKSYIAHGRAFFQLLPLSTLCSCWRWQRQRGRRRLSSTILECGGESHSTTGADLHGPPHP